MHLTPTLSLLIMLSGIKTAWSAAAFEVTPSQVSLHGKFARAQLLVRDSADNTEPAEKWADLTGRVTWSSSDLSVVTVDKLGRLLAAANGSATIQVEFAGQTSHVAVTVTGVEATVLKRVKNSIRANP